MAGLIALATAGGAVVGSTQRLGDSAAEGSDVRTATQTVVAYFEALGGQDCPAAIGLVSELSWQPGGAFANAEEAAASCTSGALLGQTPALTVEHVEVISQEGDRITVAVAGLVDGQFRTVQLTLVQDGDGWKIQLGDPAASPAGDGPAAPPANGIVPPADPGQPPATTPTTAPGPPALDTDAAATTVRGFYSAMAAEDCETMVAMTTPDFWTSLATGADLTDPAAVCTTAFAEGHLTSDLTVEDVVLDRQEYPIATFSVALTLGPDGAAHTEMVDVVVVDGGAWKISLLY